MPIRFVNGCSVWSTVAPGTVKTIRWGPRARTKSPNLLDKGPFFPVSWMLVAVWMPFPPPVAKHSGGMEGLGCE
jgi:hypothetical protein